MGLIMLGTVVISYFILRGLFKRWDMYDKDSVPIGWLLFVMFLPFVNILLSVFLCIAFYFIDNPIDKVEFIDKIFFLKDK